MPHRFFTSYARPDNNKISGLRSVIEELRERVRAKLGEAHPEDVAFFDTTDIKTAADWERVLAGELAHAHVLVCMCSPTYFNSEFCAREFEVFRRRVEAAGDAFADARVVVPIIWDVGVGSGWMPRALTRFQYTDDRLPRRYATDGLCALKRVKGQRRACAEAVEVLAAVIAEAARKNLPPYGSPVRFAELPRSFHDPTPDPYNVAVLVLHDRGTHWQPATSGRTIAQSVDAVAGLLRVGWREIPADANLLPLLQQTRQHREAVLIVTAAAAAESPRWSPLARAIDAEALDNAALVIDFRPAALETASYGVVPSALVGASPAEADEVVHRLFPNLGGAAGFHACFPFESDERVQAEITRAIEKVRLTLVAADPAGKVSDPAFAGTPGIDRRPVLAGPGGGV